MRAKRNGDCGESREDRAADRNHGVVPLARAYLIPQGREETTVKALLDRLRAKR